MNVATIEMPVEDAQAKLLEYQEGLADREPTNEDRGIMLGLKALAKGKAVLNLHDVFRACPLDAQGLPKLALARGHWRWSYFGCSSDRAGQFRKERWSVRGNHTLGYIDFPAGTLPAGVGSKYAGDHRALVPLIPPNLRPYSQIDQYLILFEAEWQPIPPRDPMLLRPLAWPLCVVVAHWDLTELERAVLAGRLTQPES